MHNCGLTPDNLIIAEFHSYGATSIELSDEAAYPYFLRTVPADDKQARAMIALLVRFQVKYVQVGTDHHLISLLVNLFYLNSCLFVGISIYLSQYQFA